MLGEAFLRVLPYREERQITMVTTTAGTHALSADPLAETTQDTVTRCHRLSARTGPQQEGLGPTVTTHPTTALSIPSFNLDPQPPESPLSWGSSSLLQNYPDLRLVQEPDSPDRSPDPLPLDPSDPPHSLHPEPGSQEPQGGPGGAVPNQGYLVMGARMTPSLALPGSGLEPLSNSLLNGLLERQLEEVYLQHLTDSLARCSSHLGHSLLRGLVPPPQPCSQPQGPDSLEAGLEEGLEEHSEVIGYMRTQHNGPCSSHFSSPVLRISEAENTHTSAPQ